MYYRVHIIVFPLELMPLASGQALATPAVDPRAVRARQDAEVCANALGALLDLPKPLIGCALELRLARHGGLRFNNCSLSSPFVCKNLWYLLILVL